MKKCKYCKKEHDEEETENNFGHVVTDAGCCSDICLKKLKENSEEEEEKKSKEDIKREKIQKVREEEEKVFKAMISSKKKYKELVSNCYTEMDAYIEMVAEGIAFGAIIEGAGGTGKTYRSINKCKDKDLAYTDSYTTPTSFYIWLYNNREKDVLIVDDVAGLMKNDKILAFLKGALWEVNGERIINYMTTKTLQNEDGAYIPSTFEFTSGIIIITNQLNKKNSHVQAVISRVNYCKVDIPREELLGILEQISLNDYEGLNLAERKECLKHLIDKTSESTENLNIRTLFKLFQFMVYSKRFNKPNAWKLLSNKMLRHDDLLALIEELEKDDALKVEEKVKEFQKLTGKGRATYFRVKKRLK